MWARILKNQKSSVTQSTHCLQNRTTHRAIGVLSATRSYTGHALARKAMPIVRKHQMLRECSTLSKLTCSPVAIGRVM